MLKTINCRDDSLFEDRGMWTSMKKKKRCIVVAQGFYEWLKKNGGKEKIPHFTKRKDGQLMCFAGLWDCVKYEGRSKFVQASRCHSVEKLLPADTRHLCGNILSSYMPHVPSLRPVVEACCRPRISWFRSGVPRFPCLVHRRHVS